MIEKAALLNLFYKYGFDSYSKEPFLYEGGANIGICFTIKDPIYGYLKRVYMPQNINEADVFLNQYYQYKNKQGELTLENYQELYVEPIFIPNKIKSSVIPKKKNYQNRLLRTNLMLIDIIAEKINVQICTYQNLQQLNQEYLKLQKELQEKQNNYLKQKETPNLTIPQEEKIDSPLTELDNLKKEILTNKDDKILEDSIFNFVSYLENLEKDQSLLKNKYLMITTPLKITIIREKISILNKLLEKKRNPFNKKESLEPYFTKIEQDSPLSKVVSYETFSQNEEKRIQDKYALMKEMEPTTIADYLIEFDNLHIAEPLKEEPKNNENHNNIKEISYENVMISLENQFKERQSKDQNLLYINSSFLRNLYQNIMKQQETPVEYTEILNVINHPNNILAKLKIFSTMPTTNENVFRNSLLTKYQELKDLVPFHLENDLNIFFTSDKILPTSSYIFASPKKSQMPIENNLSFPTIYIAHLKQNSYIYFSPKELMIDKSNDDQMILKENTPIFIIDLTKNIVKNENSDIIKVARYEIDKKQTDKIVVINHLKRTQIDCFKHIEIERGNE